MPPPCPSLLHTKAHQTTATMMQPYTPSDTWSEPPPLASHTIPMHQPSPNPSSTFPLTTTRRPTRMTPLPDLTNITSPLRTLTPDGEAKSVTPSPTARNSRYINSDPCTATLSLNAQALSLGNIYGNAAPPSTRRNQKYWEKQVRPRYLFPLQLRCQFGHDGHCPAHRRLQ